ncbi:MAG: hypothetical protein OJF50_000303 [Nitrospira sp.]|jgi:hypothetical protein|nr:hypothetical protein [Nitrospira sp.]
MECATCLADLYPPELIANPEFDPEDTLPPLYDRYVLLPSDNEEVVVNFLVALHSAHLEQWARRDQERRLSGETRFADEDPKPEFPLIIKRSSRPHAPRFAVLPNGRRVLILDAHRVYFLCGISGVLTLEEAKTQNHRRLGYRTCPGCQGRHLPEASATTSDVSTVAASQYPSESCPKCLAPKAASYIADGPDHSRCLLCGRYEYATASGQLTEQEMDRNEDAIAGMLFAQGDLEDPFPSPEDDLSEESVEGDPDRHLMDAQDGEDCVKGLDLHEEELADLLVNTSQDLADLGDRMHKPAFELFLTSHPLRKKLIDMALRGVDHTESRMALWAAAGRILGVSTRSLSEEDSEAITQWLLTLSDEDLSIVAGDPDAQHPMLQHPSPGAFQPTDPLLLPLVKHFKEQLRRFRSKEAGCRLLAKDHGLSEEALRSVAVQCGMLPGPTPAPIRSSPQVYAA